MQVENEEAVNNDAKRVYSFYDRDLSDEHIRFIGLSVTIAMHSNNVVGLNFIHWIQLISLIIIIYVK